MKSVEKRFIEYAKLPTMSAEENECCPSSEKQFVLARKLKEELEALGLEVTLTDKCYLYATLEGNCEAKNTVGFIAHLDTSCDAPDDDIKPKTVKYEGEDILLNEEKGIYLSASEYPSLKKYVGEDLIVTDGTTLLGADDKAGIAEIVSAVEYIVENNVPHGTVKIAFTPDEEIGRGADLFDVPFFAADYAYTVDGGAIGEIEYENFNAASAVVEFCGVSIHPGNAKGKMKSALQMAHDFHALIPRGESPFDTEGYEGFYHLLSVEGCVEKATLRYIIRDHDMAKFEARKETVLNIAETVKEKWGEGSVVCTVSDSYYNMKEKIEPHIYIIDRAKAAMLKEGITPETIPIRGGTDGAQLSFKGLPCPNLCTGGENFHSRFEYIPVSSLERITKMIVRIITDLTDLTE